MGKCNYLVSKLSDVLKTPYHRARGTGITLYFSVPFAEMLNSR